MVAKKKRRQERSRIPLVLTVVGSLLLATLAGWAVWRVAHDASHRDHREPTMQPGAERPEGERISQGERQLLEEVLKREDGRTAR